MQVYKELLIGFDVREMSSEFEKLWSQQRQADYLLKTNLTKPLSTDIMVWDSVFHVANLELPSWVGPRQSLWDNLRLMREFVEEQAELNLMNYWNIGITQFVIPELYAEMKALYQITPSEIAPEWLLLGFDVSDEYLLSGLMNVACTPDEHELKAKWSTKLNNYHLFETLEDALSFSSLSNERVQEHSPFFVYGIYMIDNIKQ